VTEWPMVRDWKSRVRATVPRVRIPLSPPHLHFFISHNILKKLIILYTNW